MIGYRPSLRFSPPPLPAERKGFLRIDTDPPREESGIEEAPLPFADPSAISPTPWRPAGIHSRGFSEFRSPAPPNPSSVLRVARFYGPAPDVECALVKMYANGRGYLLDVMQAIKGAKSDIYIAGWAVCLGLKFSEEEKTMGELLQEARLRGVHVRILTHDHQIIKLKGILGEIGKATNAKISPYHLLADPAKYFADNNAEFLTRAYDAGIEPSKLGSVQVCQVKVGELLDTRSMHSKFVLVDGAQTFAGGIDAAPFRDDGPEHLLHDLSRAGMDARSTPWADMGAQFEGPAIYRQFREIFDTLMHVGFERHDTQKWSSPRALSTSYALPPLLGDIDPSSPMVEEEEKAYPVEDGHVRVKVLVSSHPRFVGWEGGELPMSQIQRAYIDAIGHAQKTIILENQYFVGTRSGHEDSSNSIPKALVQKMKAWIDAEETDWRVIIVAPLVPSAAVIELPQKEHHGIDIESSAVTRNMFKTFKWMHDKLNKYAPKVNLSEHLLVMGLGKVSLDPSHVPRAHQIYVHSKCGVFDPGTKDARTIFGSANANVRSMAHHDSETAVDVKWSRESSHEQLTEYMHMKFTEWFGATRAAELMTNISTGIDTETFANLRGDMAVKTGFLMAHLSPHSPSEHAEDVEDAEYVRKSAMGSGVPWGLSSTPDEPWVWHRFHLVSPHKKRIAALAARVSGLKKAFNTFA